MAADTLFSLLRGKGHVYFVVMGKVNTIAIKYSVIMHDSAIQKDSNVQESLNSLLFTLNSTLLPRN